MLVLLDEYIAILLLVVLLPAVLEVLGVLVVIFSFFDIDSVGVVAGVGIIGYVLDAFLVYVFSPGVIGYMNN